MSIPFATFRPIISLYHHWHDVQKAPRTHMQIFFYGTHLHSFFLVRTHMQTNHIRIHTQRDKSTALAYIRMIKPNQHHMHPYPKLMSVCISMCCFLAGFYTLYRKDVLFKARANMKLWINVQQQQQQ